MTNLHFIIFLDAELGLNIKEEIEEEVISELNEVPEFRPTAAFPNKRKNEFF